MILIAAPSNGDAANQTRLTFASSLLNCVMSARYSKFQANQKSMAINVSQLVPSDDAGLCSLTNSRGQRGSRLRDRDEVRIGECHHSEPTTAGNVTVGWYRTVTVRTFFR